MSRRQKKRGETIRAAKAESGGRGDKRPRRQGQSACRGRGAATSRGPQVPGKPAAARSKSLTPERMANFTAPESSHHENHATARCQCYRCAGSGRRAAQVIVAHGPRREAERSTSTGADRSTPAKPIWARSRRCWSAEAGYCSDASLAALEAREIDADIAPGRAKHAGEGEGGGARVAAMRETLEAGGHSNPLPTRRKQLPEPVSRHRSSKRAASVSFSCAASRRSQGVMPRLPRPQYLDARPTGGPRPVPHSQPAELRDHRNRCNDRWPSKASTL